MKKVDSFTPCYTTNTNPYFHIIIRFVLILLIFNTTNKKIIICALTVTIIMLMSNINCSLNMVVSQSYGYIMLKHWSSNDHRS